MSIRKRGEKGKKREKEGKKGKKKGQHRVSNDPKKNKHTQIQTHRRTPNFVHTALIFFFFFKKKGRKNLRKRRKSSSFSSSSFLGIIQARKPALLSLGIVGNFSICRTDASRLHIGFDFAFSFEISLYVCIEVTCNPTHEMLSPPW